MTFIPAGYGARFDQRKSGSARQPVAAPVRNLDGLGAVPRIDTSAPYRVRRFQVARARLTPTTVETTPLAIRSHVHPLMPARRTNVGSCSRLAQLAHVFDARRHVAHLAQAHVLAARHDELAVLGRHFDAKAAVTHAA